MMAAGYMIINTYDYLYNIAINQGTYDDNPLGKQIFGVPFKDFPEQPPNLPRYQGIGRDQLVGITFGMLEDVVTGEDAATPAENLLGVKQEDNETCCMDIIPSFNDALEVMSLLGDEIDDYEIIYVRDYKDETPVPENCRFLGCDAADMNFSCICDSMFFPKWHGTDPGNPDFQRYFDSLNKHGLFDTNEKALEFLAFYLSFDWTERSDEFTSIEIYAVE